MVKQVLKICFILTLEFPQKFSLEYLCKYLWGIFCFLQISKKWKEIGLKKIEKTKPKMSKNYKTHK